MLDRLVGVEQEYAVCFRPGPSARHPGNRELFLAVVAALSRRLVTRSAGGMWGWSRERLFTETGGSIYYESLPPALDGGLVEAATPECRGPSEAMRYARAWDRLLDDAARAVSRQTGGQLVLRKNGRDAQGHVYGPQESYEVDLATGVWLWLWRTGLVLLAPLALVASLLHLATVLTVLVGGVILSLFALVAAALLGLARAATGSEAPLSPTRWADATIERLIGVERVSLNVFLGPVMVVASLLLRVTAWRPYRRHATGFLVTRMLTSGAGSLEADGSFVLSEKASAIRRELRWSFHPQDRGLLEVGHILKGLLGPMLLRPEHLVALFGQRQRLQLGMSDANACEVAEYLKLATTALVLDLVEAGALQDAPRPADPIAAARAISAGGPHTPVPLADGRTLTALQVQRAYADRAATWIEQQATASLEAHALVRRWQAVLDALEHDPESLVGQLDWVTKRALLHAAGDDLSWEEKKAIDLRYHDLGEGYHAWLVGADLCDHLVTDEEIERAMRFPPSDTPAAIRGALVRGLGRLENATIDWRSAHVGGKVIRFRRPPGGDGPGHT